MRYDVVMGDSGLVIRHRKLPDSPLVPAFADGFTGGFGNTIIFTRDRANRIAGFTITDGRVRGVRFERQSGATPPAPRATRASP